MSKTIIRRVIALALVVIQVGIMYPISVFGDNHAQNNFEAQINYARQIAEQTAVQIAAQTAQNSSFSENKLGKTTEQKANIKIPFRLPPSSSSAELIKADEGGTVRLGNAEIHIPAGALSKDTLIKITRLRTTEDTGDEIKNATAGGGGYRFEPKGTVFSVPATIRMGFEYGLTESAKESLYTYFYNTEIQRWESLERESVEEDHVVSLTTHFTDMINGTLSLPEGPAPLRFNINSIKGLEAANPSAGIPAIEGLEANNTGSANFSIPIEIPPGRAGMAPRVAISYSSDGGNGIMGRGFSLQAGGSISTDTRYGVPRFNGKKPKNNNLPESIRDTYLLDGVMLQMKELSSEKISYEPLRETKYERIERFIGDNIDYWVVTDKMGTQRTYGMNDGYWSGVHKDKTEEKKENKKFIWELEKETDVFGNTIRYVYEREGNEFGQLFLKEIIYTEHKNDKNLAAYKICFKYGKRDDVRVDGRGGYVSKTERRLEYIIVKHGDTDIRVYMMKYEKNVFSASQLTEFGQLTFESLNKKNINEPDEYLWSYKFEFNGLKNGKQLFSSARKWLAIDRGLQVQHGTSSGIQASMSFGVGVGFDNFDLGADGGFTVGGTNGSSETAHTFIDINGDGKPDSVSIRNGKIRVLVNNNGRFTEQEVKGDSPGTIGNDENNGTTIGWNVGGGPRIAKKVNLSASYVQTKQTGSANAKSSFADVDGDGLVDVIIAGDTHYYKNTSDGIDIRFKKERLAALDSAKMPSKMRIEMSDPERKKLESAFSQETPLREWRAPEKGTIKITQKITTEESFAKEGNLIAQTYHGEDTNPIRKINVNKGNYTFAEEDNDIEINDEESLYFLGDAGFDTRKKTIDWNVEIAYNTMRYLGDMDKQLRYVPSSDYHITVEEYKKHSLSDLFDEAWDYFLIGNLTKYSYNNYENKYSQNTNGTYIYDELTGTYKSLNGMDLYKLNDKEEYERIYSSNPLNNLYVYKFSHYALSNRDWEDIYAAKDYETKKIIWEIIRDNGWFVPGYITSVNFKFLWDKACEEDEKPDSNTNYRQTLIGYYQYFAAENAYIRNKEAEAICSAKNQMEKWRENELIIENLIQMVSLENEDYLKGLSEYILDKDIETMYPLPNKNSIKDIVVEKESADIITERKKSMPGYIYPAGENKYRLVTDFIDKQKWSVDFNANIIFKEEKVTINKGTPSEREEIRYSFEITNPFNNTSEINYYINDENKGKAKVCKKEGITFITIPVTFNDITQYELFYEFDKFNWTSNILENEYSEIESVLKFYETDEDILRLKNEFNNNITASFLNSLIANNLTDYFEYRDLITESLNYGFMHYTGDFKRAIRYNAGGIYKIEDGKIEILILEENEEGKSEFVNKHVGRRETKWNSLSDYTIEMPESFYFTEEGNFEDLPEDNNLPEEMQKEKFTYKVNFENAELLTGGKNRWYYGIWFGSQQNGSEFSQKKLTDQKNREASSNNTKAKDRQNQISKLGSDDLKSDSGGGIEKDDQKLSYAPLLTVAQIIENLNIPSGSLYEYGSETPMGGKELVGNISWMLDRKSEESADKTYFSYIFIDKLNTSRSGGYSYYEIPGVIEEVDTEPETENGVIIHDIRKSNSDYTDIAVNAGINITGEKMTFMDDVLEKVETKGLGANYNYGYNEGESYVTRSVQSMSGSGASDLVVIDTSKNIMSVITGSLNGFADNYDVAGIPYLSKNESDTTLHGGTIGASGSVTKYLTSDGKTKGQSINGGGGGSYSFGDNIQTAGFTDMNGDGLPDYVSGDSVTLNLGREKWEALSGFTGIKQNEGESKTIGISASLGCSPSETMRSNDLSSSQVNISGGLNYSVTMNETKSMLMDMNGDGLPDKVTAKDGKFKIYYNLGNRFQNSDEYYDFDSASGWDISNNDFVFAADGNLSVHVLENLPLIGGFIGNSGVLDSFANKDGALNFFASDMQKHLGGIETTVSSSIGLNAGAGFSGTVTKIPVPPACITKVNVTMNVNNGFNTGANISGLTMRLIDVDGDGLPDRVLRVPGKDNIYVQLNMTGEVGLIKKITLPQGGEYEIKYKYEGGTFKMPQSRYVMEYVTKRDNAGKNGIINPLYESEHEYTVQHEYLDGYYNRSEKEFYGFETVETKPVKKDTLLTERTVTKYFMDSYKNKGMVKSAEVFDDENEWRKKTVYTADNAPRVARYTSEKTEIREKAETGYAVINLNEKYYSYDNFGNVTKLVENANKSNTVIADVTYWHGNTNKYLYAHPKTITVSEINGGSIKELRRREGEYNLETGALEKLTQIHGASWERRDTAELKWDNYGNLKSITDPKNAYTSYEYDDEYLQYVKTINAGGDNIPAYSSHIEWNMLFGKKRQERDENENTIDYKYDPYGRLIEVRSPYDTGTTPAVRHEYKTDGVNRYALTENKVLFDSSDESVLQTVIMTDGLGRVLFTAKQGMEYKNGGKNKGWNVSGFTAYDDKGRTVASGQPIFIEGESVTDLPLKYSYQGIMKNPTKQEYDSLDRVKSTTLPSQPGTKHEQTVEYKILNGKTWTITTDPLKNISKQGSDGRGNITNVERYSEKETDPLTTATYSYNALGEMLEAIDADGNKLTVEYDRLGRRTKMTSPDMGTKGWRYDKSGNLEAEWDSELVRQGKEIKYIYDGLNRLIKIDYPFSMDTDYVYGTSAEKTSNAAGRIKSMTDETGTINYTYGDLGQVIEETRTINLLPSDKKEKMSAIMKYKSDYLGRMQEITYPDGEIVTYGYDHGGQITSVKGIRGADNTEFVYVKDIGYDEYGQRVYIEYGTGIKTNYTYDPYRRWLKDLKTAKENRVYQDINYSFDPVGNVLGYTNNSYNHTTTQTYKYDDLYQLIIAKGESAAHQYVGQTDYTTTYNQNFSFDKIGNMTSKKSTNYVSTDIKIGDNLTYDLNYKYYKGTHKAEIIGDKYYTYDLNGNLVAEREGEHAKDTEVYRSYHKDGEIYYTEYGFGFAKPQGVKTDDGVFQRNYKWNERNLLRESSDSTYTVQYRYGADGQRAIKYVLNNGRSTLYFNNMWQVSDVTMSFVNSKHIFVGEERIATKYNTRDNENVQEEMHRVYYYHSDHLGSAQTVTNYLGNIHERLEYTPYGELWIDYKDPNQKEDGTPFRFTGKERDLETGLYYYGARYLDGKTSIWLSVDPAMYQGDYLPSAPINDEARKRNGNLPGMGGVFNYVNLHVYHYAGNNPVKYVDPDGLSGELQIFAHENHAWITFTSDDTGETKTIGTWGNKEDHKGVYYNLEAGLVNDGFYKERVSLSVHIDDDKEAALFAFIAENDRWEVFYNCANFAADAWTAAGQTSLGNKTFGIIPTPSALARSIRATEGYQKNAPIIPREVEAQKAKSSSNPYYDSSYLFHQSSPELSSVYGSYARSFYKSGSY